MNRWGLDITFINLVEVAKPVYARYQHVSLDHGGHIECHPVLLLVTLPGDRVARYQTVVNSLESLDGREWTADEIRFGDRLAYYTYRE